MPSEVLLGLFCTLLAVTVIGHGLWVMFAALFRFLGMAPSPSQGVVRDCPHCGSRACVVDGRCRYCGTTPLISADTKKKQDRAAMRSYLEELVTRRLLSGEDRDRLLEAIARDEQGVYGPRPEHSAVTETPPVVTPPAEAIPTAEPMLAEVVDVVVISDDAAPAAASIPVTSQRPPPRYVHPLDRPTVAEPPRPPQRPWSDMVQAFFEEKNIRFVEVLAGLLIVVSSVALIISLREPLQKIPYFPAMLFLTFNLAFHGAGLYSLRKWKLRTVSRAVLIIALLLAPLSFAASIVLSQTQAGVPGAITPLFLFVNLLGAAGAIWVAWSSATELTPRSIWPLTVAIVGCSLSQVFLDRLSAETGSPLWPVAIPVATALVGLGSQILIARGKRTLGGPHLAEFFLAGGTTFFALLVAISLFVARHGQVVDTLARLTPLFSLVTAAAVALGALIHQRTRAKALAPQRTAGTAIAIVFAILQLVWIGLAWPRPELLITLGVLNAVVLITLAAVAELPVLYAAAVWCASFAALVGFHHAQGRTLPTAGTSANLHLVTTLLAGRSAVVLGLCGALAAAIGVGLTRFGRRKPGQMLLAGAAGPGVIAILTAVATGFLPGLAATGDPALATPVLLTYAALLLAVSRFVAGKDVARVVTVVGTSVLWLGLVHAFWLCGPVRARLIAWDLLPNRPVIAATMWHSLLCAAAAVLAAGKRLWQSDAEFAASRQSRRWTTWIEPLAVAAFVSSLAPLPWVVIPLEARLPIHSLAILTIGAVWGALAFLYRRPEAMTACQVAWSYSAAIATAFLFRADREALGLLAPRHVAGQVIALAGAAIVWRLTSRFTVAFPITRRLLTPPWPATERFLAPLAVRLFLAVTSLVVIPAALAELAVKHWTLPFAADDLARTPLVWFAVAMCLVTAALHVWAYTSLETLLLAPFALATIPLVAAGLFVDQNAVAPALRWGFAGLTLLTSAALIFREPLAEVARKIPGRRGPGCPPHKLTWLRTTIFVTGTTPIAVFTLLAVAQGVNGVAIADPAVGSFWNVIGQTADYAGPLAAIVVVFLAFAVRERQPAYAFGGFLTAQIAANLALLLWVAHHPAAPASQKVAFALQSNALAAAIYGWLWFALSPWMSHTRERWAAYRIESRRVQWLDAPLIAASVFVVAMLVWSVFVVWESPSFQAAGEDQLARPLSWVAAGLWLTLLGVRLPPRRAARLALATAGTTTVLCLLGITLDHQLGPGRWSAFHVLEFGFVGELLAVVAAMWVFAPMRKLSAAPRSQRRWTAPVALLLGLGVICQLFALRSVRLDPWAPAASVVTAALTALAFVALALHRRSQRFAYVSAAAITLAWLIGWWELPRWNYSLRHVGEFAAAFDVFALAAMTVAGVWLGIDLWLQRRESQTLDPQARGIAVHRAALCLALAVAGFQTALHVVDAAWSPVTGVSAVEVIRLVGLAPLGALFVAALWDRAGREAVPGMYLTGWLLTLFAVALAAPQDYLLVGLVAASAAYVAIVDYVWFQGAWWSALGTRYGVSDPVGGLIRVSRWLPATNTFWSVLTAGLATALVLLRPEREERIAAAFVPFAGAIGSAFLCQPPRRAWMQQVALGFGALGVCLLAWSDLPPEHLPDAWLIRSIRLLVALGVTTFAYGVVAPRVWLRSGDWPGAFRLTAAMTGAAAVAALLAVLALEFQTFDPQTGAPIELSQVLVVAIVLVGLIAGLLAVALSPDRDPLKLTDDGRQGYVYAAQVVAVMLFAHLFLCRPEFFRLGLLPYWPYILVAIAFAGVGAAELFQRTGHRVLAEPLRRTGSFLPLIPAIAFWWLTSQTDYSAVLFLVGLVWTVLAFTQQSTAAALAAAAAGNGALWALLARKEGLGFLAHPQFWLIPPALSVLVAAHINRRRLDPQLLTAIRYAAMLTIYVSSAGEMFLRGIGTSLWGPIILATISLAGVAGGIALRIRAFLYLGAAFLLLSLVSMVWHAARAIDQVWPWWAFGIVSGIAILVFFGVFEKKRAEIEAQLVRLKQWEQ